MDRHRLCVGRFPLVGAGGHQESLPGQEVLVQTTASALTLAPKRATSLVLDR